jgi:hypothetical protein
MPISTLKGSWTRLLSDERLRRSSQVLSVIENTVCVYGGEVKPREPIDDQIDMFSLKPGISRSGGGGHHGTTLTALQRQQIYKQNHHLQRQAQESEAHLLYSMARCTSFLDAVAPKWPR